MSKSTSDSSLWSACGGAPVFPDFRSPLSLIVYLGVPAHAHGAFVEAHPASVLEPNPIMVTKPFVSAASTRKMHVPKSVGAIVLPGEWA
jgi:hypothetical protein